VAQCSTCRATLRRGQCTTCESRRKRRQRYGLSEHQWQALRVRSRGLCEGCGDPLDPERLVIDHCHPCEGKGRMHVRGLLCHSCNVTLGQAQDRVQRLQGLVMYLLRTRTCER